MKKSLLAIALSSLVGVALAQSSAQSSSITLYGIVDGGLVYNNGSDQGALTTLGSGLESGSRLGVKGREDLGNGLAGLFVLEQGLNLTNGDTAQGGRAFGRQAWLGLESMAGTVSFGRQYTPTKVAYDTIDPFFNGGNAGTIASLFGQDVDVLGLSLTNRDISTDNTVSYKTPSNLGGFYASVAYSFGGVAGNSSTDREIGASVGYNGTEIPLTLVYAYQQDNHNASPFYTDENQYDSHFLGAMYDFGIVKLHAAYDHTERADLFKTQSYMIGATIPFGAHALFADYIHRNNKLIDDANANRFAIGYNYYFSKRTNFYLIGAYTKNDTNSSADTPVDAPAFGKSVTQFNIGVRHTF